MNLEDAKRVNSGDKGDAPLTRYGGQNLSSDKTKMNS